MDFQNTLSKYQSEALAQLQTCTTKDSLETWHKAWLGKNGKINEMNRSLKDITPENRPTVGAALQTSKTELQTLYDTKLASLTPTKAKQFDFTASYTPTFGTIHPLTHLKTEISQVFLSQGFTEQTGRDIETEYYNFQALNTPAGHPSRSMRDTFYLSGDYPLGERMLLRTHTTALGARIMEQQDPPIRSIAYGNVYRRDDDATHTPMFTQLEGLIIEEGLSVHSLKTWILSFVNELLPGISDIRFRPSFFPFTYCSAEVDVKLQGKGGWLELLGCGMMHPKILQNFNIDPSKYQGLAFGMGVERLAMLRFGIKDIRHLYRNDTLFLDSMPTATNIAL